MKRVWLLLLALPFAACASTASKGPRCGNAIDSKTFPPGESILCQCADQTQGLKTCGQDGEWSACAPCTFEEPYPDAGGPPDFGDAPYGCGDGMNDDDEICDDGNLKDGDLCNSQCVPTGNPEAAGVCPGQPLHLWGSSVTLPNVDTSVYPNRTKAETCATEDGGPVRLGGTSPERIYEVHAHREGTLVVTTRNSTFDHLLYIRKECNIPSTEVACSNRNADNTSEMVSASVVDGDVRYVIIDGALVASGQTTVTFEIKAP